ncbi:MAG: glycerophosphodiester phosphodiesterase [Propionibacteriales bacterium]|nr:glycerophosphodiester phosphodiesterase [Propionibacteriales bacterium]
MFSRLRGRALASVFVLAVATAGLGGTTSYATPTADRGERTTTANPWLDRRVMNMAHQGGEAEAPSNTLYAFKRAVELGADMIELDVHSTKDDKLVVIHDATVDRTTNGTGRVRDMTRKQVQALDAAYDFDPEGGYPFRGVRTRDVPPPEGYKADDFKIPTLREVFRAFRDVPINIEIKGTADTDTQSFLHNAELLAEFLNRRDRTDVIVVSFEQLAVTYFHQLAPQIDTAPGTAGLAAYWALGIPPGFGTKALQVPIEYQGVTVTTPEFVQRAHTDGFAVHVWLSSQEENEDVYNQLIDMCVDGIMAAYPTRLEKVLDDRGITRPGEPGVDPCI